MVLPLISVIEYFATMKLMEMGYCTPCVCRFCPSFHLHGQVTDQEEDDKNKTNESAKPTNPSSSFADMQGVPFVDAEAGEAAPAPESAGDGEEDEEQEPIQRVNTYKRKKRGSVAGSAQRPSVKSPSRLSFKSMSPFGRRKSEELKVLPDVAA